MQTCAAAPGLTGAEVVDRLRSALGLASDGALARHLGASRMTVSSWRTRDSRPYAACVAVAEETGVSLDWLLLGTGPMRRERSGADRGAVAKGDSDGYPLAGERMDWSGVMEAEGGALEQAAIGTAAQAIGLGIGGGDAWRLVRLLRWLLPWWARASSDDRTWLDGQLQRAIPEYADTVRAETPGPSANSPPAGGAPGHAAGE